MISDFSSWNALDENVQAAKELLVKNFEEKANKKVDEDFKKKIWSNPKYLEIKDYIEKDVKSPGLVYLFTKLYVIEKCTMDKIKMLVDGLKNIDMKSLPLGNIDAYAKITDNQGSSKDGQTGHEKLEDDINFLLAKKKLKKAYDEMTPRMKSTFKELSNESSPLIDKLQDLVLKLLKTAPKVTKEGEKILAWKAWVGTGIKGEGGMKKYDDTHTYPAYDNPVEAFKGMIADAENILDNWGTGFEEKLNQLEDLNQAVRIFYADAGLIASSARSVKAQIACSGESTHCINDPGAFWTYAGTNLQINILNYNLSQSDPNRLISMTITPSGRIHHAQNFRNRGELDASGTYVDLLKRLKYPESLINSIKDNFNDELEKMKVLSGIFKMIDTKNIRGLEKALSILSKYERDTFHGEVETRSESAELKGFLKNVTREFKSEELKLISIEWAMKTGGLFDMPKIVVFKQLVDKITPRQKVDILELTLKTLDDPDTGIESIIKNLEENPEDQEYNFLLKRLRKISKEKALVIEEIKNIKTS